METTNVKAFGTDAATAPLKEMNIQRRALLAKDIEIDVMYCGVCHSDLHAFKRNEHSTPRLAGKRHRN